MNPESVPLTKLAGEFKMTAHSALGVLLAAGLSGLLRIYFSGEVITDGVRCYPLEPPIVTADDLLVESHNADTIRTALRSHIHAPFRPVTGKPN